MLPTQGDPESSQLFGGMAGAALGVDEFEVCPGLVLRQTYAHVMSPYILAFKRPESRGQHHPAPWKSARGGVFVDVEIEVALDEGTRPTGFDRLNTLWWVVALLRLSTGATLRMPVVSDASFADVATSTVEPDLWPIEMLPSQIPTVSAPPQDINEDSLLWLRGAFVSGATLMRDALFGRAFQTLDGAIWAHSPGSAIVTVWAALETLVRPGRTDIGKRLAMSVAALLEPPGTERDRLFQRAKGLYEARGSSAHASQSPEVEQLVSSFDIARRSFMASIDSHTVPDSTQLQEMWRLKQ